MCEPLRKKIRVVHDLAENPYTGSIKDVETPYDY
jgi:hypothetical protein